ncbi:phenylacetaldoxime dehydratase family protein [Chelativorans alearense]|uniref:phenylacetaldoxime dehydratase family protein n=1 Tax=Chelativorans alearense TaxID=2681495 RepID=UPI0013D0AE87|nr:phenylacetaldoxime dehydratase family protein [Chelativorans alearense]
MEPAIPGHLVTARTRHPRVGADYEPPYPSYVARHRPSVKSVVMAYFGLQFRPENAAASVAPLAAIAEAFAAENGPGHWDRARCDDAEGFINVLSIAYWDDPARFEPWFAARGANWTGEEPAGERLGFFTEILKPAVERYETLFSASDRAEGVAVVADGMSGTIREHAYWGGMRDRIPLSQTDAMDSAGGPRIFAEGGRLRVIPHENICLIRSGQDWTDMEPEERRMYLEEVEPVLRAGMDFLSDEGLSCGCFANRYMQVIDAEGRLVEKSFGMSWWKSLAALERWAESHPSHVAIFGAAMQYLSKLGPAAKLRLYHEVTVATADQQFFEYRNCHPKTGLLRTERGVIADQATAREPK